MTAATFSRMPMAASALPFPMRQNFTLIGTTDEDHKGDPGAPRISERETDYLLAAVSEYFKRPVTREQVRWAYSGIRPLYDDGASKAQEATRDYVLKLDHPRGRRAAALGVRRQDHHVPQARRSRRWKRCSRSFRSMGKPWTATASLPGGDFPFAEVEQRIAELSRKYSFLQPAQCAPHVPGLWHRRGEDLRRRALCRGHGQEFRPAHRTRGRVARRPRNGRAVPMTSCGGARSWACIMSQDEQDALRQLLCAGGQA